MKVNRLTSTQYDSAKTRAKKRILHDLYNRSSEIGFWGNIRQNPMNFLINILLIALFLPALAVSTVHISDFVAHQMQGYQMNLGLGFGLSDDMVIKVHQIAYVSMAESALVFFLLMHSLTKLDRKGRNFYGIPTHFFSVSLFLSFLAVAFIFYANLKADLPTIVAIMPPFFTIGIGARLEMMVVEELSQKREIELFEKSPEKHPLWNKILNQEIWEKLVSKSGNSHLSQFSLEDRKKVILNERQREFWSDFSLEKVDPVEELEDNSDENSDNKRDKIAEFLSKNPENIEKTAKELKKVLVNQGVVSTVSLPTIYAAKRAM